MNSVQEQLLFTTLRIECLDATNNICSIGTGFLLSRPVDDNNYKLYLVSNKHVLSAAESINLTFTIKNNNFIIGDFYVF